MATLVFKVQADYEKVIRLREEIEKLKSSLKGIDPKSAEFSRMNRQLEQTTRQYKNLTKAAAEGGAEIERHALSISKAMTAIGGLAAIKGLVSQMIEVRGQFQAADTAIQTLLGSKEKADELLSKVREYAKISPLEFGDITRATQMMLGFNIEANKVPGFIKAIGDVSMGESGKFNSLTLAFSQMSAAGKLMGQDLNQMINAGFNPLSVMAEKTGKSIAELKEEMSKGAITAEMVQQAFMDATSEGGKFFNMSENAAKTINGQISMLHDAIDSAFNEMGTASEGFIVKSISGLTKLAENYETVGKIIVSLIATYGTYKAAVMTLTAVQALQTAGVGALTAAETIHYGWLVLCEKAQKLLNATMLDNPYVAVATLIVGVTAALWTLSSSTDEAAEAQKKLNDTVADYKAKAAAEQAEIDRVFDKLRKAKEGTQEYKDVKDQIINQYGKYLSGLSSEIATLKDVEGAYKAVTRAAREASLARGKEAALRDVQDKYGKTYSENYQKLSDSLVKNVGEKRAKDLMGLVRKDLQKYGEISKKTQGMIISATNNLSATEYDAFLNDGQTSDSYKFVQKLNNNEKYLNEYTKQVEEKFKIEVEEKKSDNNKKVRNKKVIEDEKGNLQAQLENLSKEDAVGKKGLALRKQIAEKNKELEAYSVKSGAQTSSSAKIQNKEDKQVTEIAKERQRQFKKQQEEDVRIADERKQLEDTIEDAVIAAIENNGDRERREREVQHKRNLRQIQEQEEQFKQEAYKRAEDEFNATNKDKTKVFSDTDKGKAGWRGMSLSEDQNNLIRVQRNKENAEYERYLNNRRKEDRKAYRDFISEYGNYEQQRLAITQEYEEKIKEAANPYDAAAAMLERDKKTKELNTKQVEDIIDWAGVFNDLSGHTEEYLTGLRDQLQQLLASGTVTDVTQMETIQEKIREINDAINEQGGMFKYASEAQREHNRRLQEAKDAQDALNVARQQEREAALEVLEIQNQISSLLGQAGLDADTDIDKGIEDVFAAQYGEESKELGLIRELLAKYFAAQGKLQGAEKNTKSKLFTWKKAENAAEEGFKDMLARVTDNIASWCNTYLGDLPDLLNSIGLGKLGEKAQSGLDAVNAAAGAAADFASGNYIGAAMKGISAVKNFGRVLGIGGGNEKEVAETTERLTKANEVLADRISDLTEVIGNSAGQKAISAYEAALEAQKELQKNNMEILRAQMGYHSSHHSNAHYASDREIRELFGNSSSTLSRAGYNLNINGLESIYGLTPEELKAIKDFAPQLWSYLTEVGKYDKSEYWEQVVEQAGRTEELTEQINNNLTQTSFDSLRDSFLDALTDMESSSEDFAKSFEEMMFKAVMNSLVLNDEFDAWLQNWQKKYAEAVKNNNTNELEALREEAVKKRDLLIQERDMYVDLMDYDVIMKDQSATSRGIQNITQDQADQLIGRVTAVQIAVEQGNAKKESLASQLTLANATASEILSLSSRKYDIVADTQRILSETYIEVKQINEHTESIDRNIKDMKSDIQEIKKTVKEY